MHHITENILAEMMNLSMISKICDKHMSSSKNRTDLYLQMLEALVF